MDALLALLLELLEPLVSLEFHTSGGLVLGFLELDLEVAFGRFELFGVELLLVI